MIRFLKRNVSLLLYIVAMFLFSACGSKMSEDEVKDYVAGFSSKYFGGDKAKIIVSFNDDVLKDREKFDGFMTFSPSLSGVFTKEDDYTLAFIPDSGSVKYGSKYECCLKLANIIGGDLKDFVFTVEAIAPQSRLTIDLVRVDPTSDDKVVATGRLMLSSAVSVEKIKPQMFSIENKVCDKINIENGERQGTYKFEITGIEKENLEREKKLSFNGKSLGIDMTSVSTFNVPAKGVFKPTCAVADRSDENAVKVYFSEKLDSNQDVDGLVYLTTEYSDGPVKARTEKFDDYVKLTSLYHRPNSDDEIHVSEGIKSASGKKLSSEQTFSLESSYDKPSIEILDKGLIMADPENAKLSFSAQNIFAVDIDIVKIYAGNVLAYLREDNDGEYSIRRYGRVFYHKTVRLDDFENFNLSSRNDYCVDLKGVFDKDPSAVYRVYLSFKKDYTVYAAGADSRAVELNSSEKVSEKMENVFDLDGYYDMSDAMDLRSWSSTDNPEDDDYYSFGRCVDRHTYLLSNLGVTVKRADDKTVWVSVANILNVDPVKGAKVTTFNYQLQPVGEATTDGDGFCEIESKNVPYYVQVEKDGMRSYVKVSNGSELSYSKFDVSGEERQKGVKAFVYGERNVWRPGDTLFLSVMIEDSEKKLPSNCPVVAEMFNPQGQYYSKRVSTRGENGLYTFKFHTNADDQTGLWRVVFEIGGRKFTQYVRIATIKPNRIKIDLKSKSNIINAGKPLDLALQANWLMGSPASSLKYKLEAELSVDYNPFPEYKSYTFTNPILDNGKQTIDLGEGSLDGLGHAAITSKFGESLNKSSASVLNATVIARVFENGGDASIVSFPYKVSPYSKYVGVDLDDRNFETDKDLKFDVVVLDINGKKCDSKLDYSVYKLEWNWWEEYDSDRLRHFVSSTSLKPEAKGTLTTRGGVASVPFRIDYPSWGRYLVYVTDEGGHSAGGVVTIDWPSYRGMSNKSDATASTMVMFSTDKDKYQVGEKATVYIPAAKGAKVLVSIESGNRVLSREWIDASDDIKQYKFELTPEMSPNCYVAMSVIYPYSVTAEGLPIRKYGVRSVNVENKETHLTPTITMDDNLWPQKPFNIKVAEKNGKAMSYTLAIVDEGLLDITSFKTPDPWSAMNKKEALLLRTYDMYSDILSARTSYFSNVLSIGGDAAVNKSANKEKRFNPVVKFIGPFKLKAGATNDHKLQLPMYVGSVRVMVVACDGNKAYGSADKSVTVSSPLMVLTSLPRILTNSETFKLAVNVFSTVKNGQNATVSVDVDGPMSIVGGKTKQVNFTKEGDKIVYFDLKCDDMKEGTAHIRIKASSSVMTTNDEIAIEVRNPQPNIVDSDIRIVANGGSSESFTWTPFVKTNKSDAVITLSPMPNINVPATYNAMMAYPYCCSEQVSSRLLFFLNADKFISPSYKEEAKKEIDKLLSILYERQLSNGGFRYWPGNTSANEWVSCMAGHALLEARRQGYEVPDVVVDNWLSFQSARARAYVIGKYDDASMTQSYRLYTLALAKKADEAAMNKLKETYSSPLLASAYAMIGRKNVAREILDNINAESFDNRSYYWHNEWTFGSSLRDKSLYLESLALCEESDKAMEMAQLISKIFRPKHCSTSEAAYTMVAMSRLSGLVSTKIESASVSQSGKELKSVSNSTSTESVSLDVTKGDCKVVNESSSPIFASLCLIHKPAPTEAIPAQNNGLEISVVYTNEAGKEISLSNIKQGTELTAKITVKNNSMAADSRMMALSYAWPSGFEPWNDIASDSEGCDYVDQRDDKKIWHFVLASKGVKTFKMKLRAAYCGDFVLPSTVCEDMYESVVNAHTASSKVKISE